MLCQKQGQAKEASSQQDQAGQSKQQASKDQSQLSPEQSKQSQAQGGREQGQQFTQDQSRQQGQAGQQFTQDQSRQGQAGQSALERSRAGGTTQTIKGQFVRMEGDFYILKDQSGKETCIPTSYGTFVDQTFSPGDSIVARLGQDGNALLIGRPGDRQSGSSNFQGQEMNQGTGDQRGDRSFAEGQQGSQDQGMTGPSDQSRRGKDFAGSQGSQSQGMTGSGDQSRRDRDFAASQPGSQQGQDLGAGTGDPSTKSRDKGKQTAASVVKGELLKIQGEWYTVKETSGNEVRLHVNKETKMESPVNVGDKIEAERTASDHAVSIKKAQDR